MSSIKRTKGERVFGVINVIIMTIIMIVTVYPLLHVVFASISDPSRLIKHQGALLAPLGFSNQAYKMVFQNPSIFIGYKNTLFYVLVGTTINLFMTSLGAYGLSRKNLLWGKPIMFLVVFTMFFGGGLIPFFLTVKNLGMLNTRWAIVIPSAISTWNLIVMRTSFMGIPDSLEESARIDGANDIVILFKIILPLSLPVLAVMALFYGVGHWNGWFDAVIFLRNRALYPLQVFLREILIINADKNTMSINRPLEDELIKKQLKYCTIIVATAPILCIYPFLQKYFVKGVMVGAIKG
ncbi:MAG: carbohydrate ABC transporter permease [Xylanivirga thermophila]|jgi:putative aldouronate transport system permease protein|uniref:carbohydrate ABC transporter permease n=1 Tax=Xylanivirga thermophila TaxID=2496273 RepID=UPI0039F6296A